MTHVCTPPCLPLGSRHPPQGAESLQETPNSSCSERKGCFHSPQAPKSATWPDACYWQVEVWKDPQETQGGGVEGAHTTGSVGGGHDACCYWAKGPRKLLPTVLFLSSEPVTCHQHLLTRRGKVLAAMETYGFLVSTPPPPYISCFLPPGKHPASTKAPDKLLGALPRACRAE